MADKLGSAGLAMRFVLIRFDMADEIRFDVMRCYGFWRVALGCGRYVTLSYFLLRYD